MKGPIVGSDLSGREAQILPLIADGWTDARIAEMLGISVDTVKSLVKRLYVRLGAHNRANAVDVGWRRGLLR